jgi:hypothetical protein
MVVHICNPNYSDRKRRIEVQGWPMQKHETLFGKQTKSKRTRDMTQVARGLTSKSKVLS